MKKIVLLVVFVMIISFFCFAYEVGDTVEDLNWADSNGEEHSIYELTAQEKVILFFWGDHT